MNYLRTILQLFRVGIFIFLLNLNYLYSQKTNTSPSDIFDRRIDIGDRFLQLKYSKGGHYFRLEDKHQKFTPIEMNSFSFLSQISPFYKFALGSTFHHGQYWSASNISEVNFQGSETDIQVRSNASYFNFNIDLHYFINDFQYSFRPFVAASTGMEGFYTRTRFYHWKRNKFRNFDAFHSNRNIGFNLTFIGGAQIDLFENHISAELSFGYRWSSRNQINLPADAFLLDELGNPDLIYDQSFINKSSYFFNVTFLLNILSTSIE